MEPKDQSDKVERYLRNQMSEEEKMEFENTIKDDPELSDELELEKDLEDLAGDEDFNAIYPKLKAEDEAQQKKRDKGEDD